MHTKLLFLVFCCLFKSNNVVQADHIIGNWLSEDKRLIVQIYESAEGPYCGKIVWFTRTEADTADMEECALPIHKWLGTVVMKDFRFDDGEWVGGQIKDLRSCKTYDAYVRIENNNILKVTGYYYFRIFGETLTFQRYNLPIPER